MCSYVDEMQPADTVIIAGGRNDHIKNVEIGKLSDKTGETFYGALNILFNKAKERYKRVLVITPIKNKDEQANEKGYTLSDYRRAIKNAAKPFGFFVIDGEKIDFDFEKHIPDGTHPNSAGHAFYAEYLIGKITESGWIK